MNEQERTALPLVEAYPVEDKYVDGLGRLEVTGHNIRFVFYAGRPKDDGEYDREVSMRLVMPMEQIMSLLKAVVATPGIFSGLDAVELFRALSSVGLIH